MSLLPPRINHHVRNAPPRSLLNYVTLDPRLILRLDRLLPSSKRMLSLWIWTLIQHCNIEVQRWLSQCWVSRLAYQVVSWLVHDQAFT